MHRQFDSDYYQRAKSFGWGAAESQADAIKLALLDQYAIGSSVLDVGCATGLYSAHLAPRFEQVMGIDIQPRLLAIAKKRTKQARFKQADILSPQFKPPAFDTVVAFDVVEHLPEDAVIKRLKRLARRRLILTVPHTTDQSLLDLFVLYGHHQDPTHLRTYTKETATTLLKKHRLQRVVVEPIHPLSTDALILALFDGSMTLKRLARKVSFSLVKPRKFYTNVLIVADLM